MSPDNIHTVHSICASAQSLFAFLIVCKSVEASGDYYTEEGGGAEDGNCRICLWSPLWCNMRPSARIRAAIAPLTQPSCHQSHDEPAEFEKPAESGKSWKHQLQTRNERESGGLASGSYLWRRWRRGARPSGRWSPGSRERSRTVPGGRGPSTDRPAAWSTDLQSLTESVSKKKKSLQGTKQREDDRREKRCPCHNQSVFRSLIYVTCHTAGSQGPRHPRKFFRRCSSEVWRLHPDLWQLRRTEEPSFFFFFFLRETCTHFHLVEIMFVFQSSCLHVWRTDGKIALTRARGVFLLVLSQNTFLPHDTMCCSVITASPNARLYHVLTLARDKKMLWSVQSKIKY